MKKIISTLLVAVCLLMVAAPAQSQLRWGLKGGLNLSKASFDKSDLKSDNFTGFFIGPMAEFTIPVIGLGVDGALLFSQKGLKIDGADETIKQNGIEIPVNLKYSFGLGDMASIFVAAGPSFYFDFSKDKGVKGLTEIKQKDAQVALNLGFGVKLINHLQIGANYNMPLTKTAEFKVADLVSADSYKSKTWQISLAYLF